MQLFRNLWAIVQAISKQFIGKTQCKTIEADGCIFNNTVIAERKQTGCLRFSYAMPGSETPRKYRCQPDLEFSVQAEEKSKLHALTDDAKTALKKEINAWLLPAFTSVDFINFAYGQLSINCPSQITTGADNGSEMGAFNFLHQPQRLANLQITLDEYLPLGLEAGVLFVT